MVSGIDLIICLVLACIGVCFLIIAVIFRIISCFAKDEVSRKQFDKASDICMLIFGIFAVIVTLMQYHGMTGTWRLW